MYRIVWTHKKTGQGGTSDILYTSREHAQEMATFADESVPTHTHEVREAVSHG